MAPPIDPKKVKEMMKNPYASAMLGKEIEMLKMAKRQKEEEEFVFPLSVAELISNADLILDATRKWQACCNRYWGFYSAL